jgi:hypothetical protein
VTPDEALGNAVDFNSPTASLTLPAGSYLLTLNVFVRATGNAYNYVECQIDDQTLHTDESKMIFVSGAFDYSRAAYITKIKTLTITDARVVPAKCYTTDEDYPDGETILLKDLTFTAIRVSSITGP